jgi:hypothetical protein
MATMILRCMIKHDTISKPFKMLHIFSYQNNFDYILISYSDPSNHFNTDSSEKAIKFKISIRKNINNASDNRIPELVTCIVKTVQ